MDPTIYIKGFNMFQPSFWWCRISQPSTVWVKSHNISHSIPTLTFGPLCFFRSRHPYRTRRAGSCRSRTTPESSVGPSCTGVTFWQVSCRSGDTLKGCYGTGCDELNGCCMDVTDITPTKWMVNMWCEWMVLSFFWAMKMVLIQRTWDGDFMGTSWNFSCILEQMGR